MGKKKHTKRTPSGITWLEAPEAGNFPAALSYLSLVVAEKRAAKLVKALREEKIVQFKSKDIFRASSLALLPVTNYHVGHDLKKIRSGTPLSPLLLVRVPELMRVVIADGYHRLCAVYALDEDAVIPCRIV